MSAPTPTTIDVTVDERLDRMAAQLDELTRELRRQRRDRQVVTDLTHDLGPIAMQAMHGLTERMGELEERGYLDFARSGLGVVDRVMTSFTEEDVEALGDNVVLILQTVREMTQPEIMSLLQRTAHLVREGEHEHHEAPSTLHLLREMRDPEVRRGLARVLSMLRSMGEAPTPDPTTNDTRLP